jgi:hypothetical protein
MIRHKTLTCGAPFVGSCAEGAAKRSPAGYTRGGVRDRRLAATNSHARRDARRTMAFSQAQIVHASQNLHDSAPHRMEVDVRQNCTRLLNQSTPEPPPSVNCTAQPRTSADVPFGHYFSQSSKSSRRVPFAYGAGWRR